jgi:UDP-2,4-diacetamido-2,4,6-trideoxy-beta-L-altropyranose hydrolase
MEQHLLIRVDASTQIGTGHLMRCLALAQAWKDAGNRVTFITNCQSDGLLQRLRDEEFSLHALAGSHPDPGDWDYTKDILAGYPGAWVVLDNYHFDEVYQQQVKEGGHPLLVINDMAHLKHYYADIVLNQNLHAEKLPYSGEPYTRLLLGTRYVLLRREFLAWRDWEREIPGVARHVLVTLGGSDAENHTLKVIQALQEVEVTGLEATVVIGASNTHADELEAAARQGRLPIQLVRDARDMPQLMAWADMAISSAGSTVWELLFMGTPALALILADNQRQIAEEVVKQGAGRNLGRAGAITAKSLAKAITLLLKDFNLRAKISKDAQQLVDGQGAQRVVASMQEGRALGLRLRSVRQKDCRLLWEWANDPAVRAASFSSEFIPWEDHEKWFRTKLSDPSCHYYILLSEEGIPVGQVRFDTSGDEAEGNVSIAPDLRGRGYGALGIQIASERLFRETAVTRIYAHIKPNNNASIQAFTEAGYKTTGTKVIKGHKALQMVLNKDDEDSKGALH